MAFNAIIERRLPIEFNDETQKICHAVTVYHHRAAVFVDTQSKRTSFDFEKSQICFSSTLPPIDSKEWVTIPVPDAVLRKLHASAQEIGGFLDLTESGLNKINQAYKACGYDRIKMIEGNLTRFFEDAGSGKPPKSAWQTFKACVSDRFDRLIGFEPK